MMSSCARCKKVIGALRILLWIAMLYFGIMKLSASPEIVEIVGGAGVAMWLTFFSIKTRFWIAVIGELLAGAMLVLGACARVGGIITFIIMVFVINATGRGWLPVVIAIVALLIARKWAGARAVIKCPCCCKGCDMKGESCCSESSSPEMKENMDTPA